MTAERAASAGLVNEVVDDGEALEGALALAERIAANGPLAVAASKKIMVESRTWPAEEKFTRMRQIAEPVLTSEDAREGAAAFGEKRTPVWKGR